MERPAFLALAATAVILALLLHAGATYVPKKVTTAPPAFYVENYDSDLRPHDYGYPRHPERIIALWQNSIETLLSLGASDDIIVAAGLSTPAVLSPADALPYEAIPIRLRQVPDLETMISLQPDLIVGWLWDFTRQSNGAGRSDFWEQRGVNVYMTAMNGADFKARHTLDDELRFIEGLGTITGKEARAESLQQAIRSEIRPVSGSPRVLVVASVARQLTIYTPRTLPGDLLTRLGADVLGKDREQVGEDEFLSYEQLLVLDPDIIFVQSDSPDDRRAADQLLHHPALKRLRAAREGRIYAVPFYLMRCPGVRVYDTIRYFRMGLDGQQAEGGMDA